METYGGGTPRRETLVYRLLTPRSTHSRAQLSLLSSVPFYHRWLQEAATMRIRFVSPRASVWVNIRECHCSVCSCSNGDSLSLFHSFSLFFSLPLFDSTLKLPSSDQFLSLLHRRLSENAIPNLSTAQNVRRSATTTPELSRWPMSSHIDFGLLSSVRVLRGWTARLRNRELRNQRRVIVALYRGSLYITI